MNSREYDLSTLTQKIRETPLSEEQLFFAFQVAVAIFVAGLVLLTIATNLLVALATFFLFLSLFIGISAVVHIRATQIQKLLEGKIQPRIFLDEYPCEKPQKGCSQP